MTSVGGEPPLVSVVTSAYNVGRYVRRSLDSVLGQDLEDLELIVVDDGSTDETTRYLEEVEREDRRVRLYRRTNQGLTAALVLGCSVSRGRYIARHDADDLSLPGRLRKQAGLLSSEPSLSLVSCHAYVVGPDGELLLEEEGPTATAEATEALRSRGRGPNGHGSAMFRADDYRAVGGYRGPFRFAQDWDLWLRLTERGGFAFVPEFLYAYRYEERGISAVRKRQQQALYELAMAAREARAAGASEDDILAQAATVSTRTGPPGAGALPGSYFIGKCLLDRRDRRALRYLTACRREAPLSPRVWLALAAAALLCDTTGQTVGG